MKVATVEELISALGGATATAKLLRLRPNAVSNWPNRGFIPARHHYRLAKEAERRGIQISDQLFSEAA